MLTAAFERMNLVGREEYDAQCEKFQELRERLQVLEARLNEVS